MYALYNNTFAHGIVNNDGTVTNDGTVNNDGTVTNEDDDDDGLHE